LYEEWYVPHPTRIIPLGIAALSDPDAAVAEIHRNAERGFTAITMPERPHLIGLPDLWQRDHWDPIIQACVDTDTVLSIHVGSSGGAESPASAPRLQLGATLFGQLSLHACAEWLWSEYPVNHPDLKLAMSEGGIGWVAMLIDRLDNIIDRSGYGAGWDTRPSDVLRRNFWFCTIDDPSTIDTRHTIGVENIMVETDFPHGDGTWPDTQLVIEKLWGLIPDDELRMMCSTNAAKLYRHPLPEVVLP
jgi:predicted TIM-barrel fold metal-dependent hydrolase